MTYTSPKLLTFEEFISQYGDNPRYELIDGELRDREPKGPHEVVAGGVAIYDIWRKATNYNLQRLPLFSANSCLAQDFE
jgi:hypothetical protein